MVYTAYAHVLPNPLSPCAYVPGLSVMLHVNDLHTFTVEEAHVY